MNLKRKKNKEKNRKGNMNINDIDNINKKKFKHGSEIGPVARLTSLS